MLLTSSNMSDQRGRLALLCWAALCAVTCQSQRDCSGVDCPDLHDCIENVLEPGACCPTCRQRGCTCQGYQYYDCVQAGFPKGKVPEGQSYFVDYGSTECSCPQGGGKISCQFIPCPEIPPNCIEVSHPADGCPQCERIGCTHGNKKYEAGHSFRLDRCQVCHCPHHGGRIMCSPLADCDPRSDDKPLWATTTENTNPLKHISSRHDGRHTSPEPPPELALGDTLPLYKQDPPSFGSEDHDDTQAEPTSSSVRDLPPPLESTTAPLAHPESSSSPLNPRKDRRHEFSDSQSLSAPESSRTEEVTRGVIPTSTEAQRGTSTVLTPTPNHRPTERTEGERTGSRSRGGPDAAGRGRSRKHKHSGSGQVTSREQESVSEEPRSTEEQRSHPQVRFSPTGRAPVRVREDGETEDTPHTGPDGELVTHRPPQPPPPPPPPPSVKAGWGCFCWCLSLCNFHSVSASEWETSSAC